MTGEETRHGRYEVPVYYEDTDFSGAVYHANYLKFCERAREHLIGIERLRQMYRDGLAFVVRRVEADFLKPAAHGDTLVVLTSYTPRRGPSVYFDQEIRVGDSPVFRAKIQIVAVSPAGKPLREHRLL
jgi:acyl-CoA thioester hydrolase